MESERITSTNKMNHSLKNPKKTLVLDSRPIIPPYRRHEQLEDSSDQSPSHDQFLGE